MEKDRYCLTPVEDKKEIEKLYQQFHLSFFGEDTSKNSEKLVCRLDKDGCTVGLAEGKYDIREKQFWVLMFYIEKRERTMSLVCDTIAGLLKHGEQRFHPEKIIWRYETNDPDKDPYLRIMKQIPDYHVKVHEISKIMRVWTDKFHVHRHGDVFYGLKTIEKKGFCVRQWKDCKDSLEEQFVRMREEADEELMELLPFPGDEYDPDTSMVLIQKETGKVCAWMICRQAAQDEVEIRKWYTLEDYRKSGIGLIFGAYMLKLLGSRYGIYQFQMKAGNHSMEGFTGKYFKDAVIDTKYARYMEIIFV